MNKQSYLIFKRWQFNVDDKMLFTLVIYNINDTDIAFQSMISTLLGESYKQRSFINVYRITESFGDKGLDKLCWIREGEIFTL